MRCDIHTTALLLSFPWQPIVLVWLWARFARYCMLLVTLTAIVQGGSTIRHIQEVSKTHVHVPPAMYGVSVCNLQISGRPEQIAVCTSMIQVLCCLVMYFVPHTHAASRSAMHCADGSWDVADAADGCVT